MPGIVKVTVTAPGCCFCCKPEDSDSDSDSSDSELESCLDASLPRASECRVDVDRRDIQVDDCPTPSPSLVGWHWQC